jgi:hypothetical protein
MKMIIDTQHRSLSFGEREGGRGLMSCKQKDEKCDATEDDSSTIAGKIKNQTGRLLRLASQQLTNKIFPDANLRRSFKKI